MGASQSVVSTEDFKNYLYGTAVLMLAPRLDTEVQFKECSKITDEDQHVLPMVLEQQQPRDLDAIIQAYCQYYGNSGKENAIDKYVQEHILDSEEHVQAFMKHLVSLLQERRSHVDASIRRLGGAHQSVQSHRSVPARSEMRAPASLRSSQRRGVQTQTQTQTPALVSTQTQNQNQTQTSAQVSTQNQTQSVRSAAHRIRGHGRLQRRLRTVDDAISQEQALYQAQQQRDNNVQESMELSYQPVEGEDIQDLEYDINGKDGDNVPDVYDELSTAEDPVNGSDGEEVADPVQQ